MRLKHLFLVLLAQLLSSGAFADDAIEIDGIYYTFSETEATVTYQEKTKYQHLSNYSGDIVIPDKVTYDGKEYSVTSIGEYAFYSCKSLSSVTIPNSVTAIGNYAFYGCSSLTTVTIPNSVTTIGDHAFYYCKSLSSVTIPNSVTAIGNYAFFGCSSLTTVTIPNSVTTIGDHAFYDCSSLTTVTIPNSVTTIGDHAFSVCSGLTSVTISEGVTSIGCYAFERCYGLTSINIPNSVTSIGESAFYICSGLTSVNISNSITQICKSTFESCSGLTSVNIPSSVTIIGESAFDDCSGLTYVNIPNSVNSIGMNAFKDCYSLTSITIPESVTNIESSAFEGCHSLTTIQITDGNTKYDSRDNCNAIIETGTNTLVYGCKNTIIPESVTSIGDYAFKASTLTAINIPESVTSIGDYAFYRCGELTSITIPSSVMTIGQEAFKLCLGLTKVIVPDIAFWCSRFNYREDSYNLFYQDNPLAYAHHLYCDEDTEITELVIPESVTRIGAGAFNGCSSLTSVTIPESVTSIGQNAFSGCSDLTSVTINNSGYVAISWNSQDPNAGFKSIFGEQVKEYHLGNQITSIGNCAFKDCRNLESINIPEGVTSIGDYAFLRCSGLTSITIPSSVTTIGMEAFQACNGLTSITIPEGVTNIGERAFCGCLGLTSVTIPNSVTSIGDNAFYYCKSLTSVTIPNSVISIGSEAFGSCPSLSSVTSLIKEPFDINHNVFGYCNATLYVPQGTKELYEAAEGWKQFTNIVEIPTEYTITYYVDGGIYKEVQQEVNEMIVGEEEPTKEGYTFSGWSEIPKTMPAEDVTVTGSFTVNSYKVTFKYVDEVLTTEMVDYGSEIPLPENLNSDRYTLIEWLDVPETMPAHDITIQADYTDGVRSVENDKEIMGSEFYQLNGVKGKKPQRGINIVRTSDGKTRKIVVK